MKSYGTATLRNGLWIIRCEPHVAVRLKRTFGNLARGKQAAIVLSASEENSRDLEWFCTRYPLEISDPETLTRLARTYDRRREVVTQILGGSAVYADLPMALPPREYQRLAAELVRTTGGLLLADDVGIGKTVAAIATMAHPDLRPALVVVPTHLQRQWKAEIERFLPMSYVHIVKRGTPYNTSHRGRAPDALIVNYHKVHGWAEHAAGKFPSVIFDEVQELRRRKDGQEITRRWAAAQTVAMRARVRLGLSVGPDSLIELRGGPFGSGWVGVIEQAYDLALRAPSDHVEARGWIGDGFGWKRVRRFIAHECDRSSRSIQVAGDRLLATDDHSIFRARADATLECIESSKISAGDILPVDDGTGWQGAVEPEVDVVEVARGSSKAQVVVDLAGVTRQEIGVTAWEWQNFHREAKYGTRVPLAVFLRHRASLPAPTLVYFGRSRRANHIAPTVRLSEWAYVLGFFLGDGWVSDSQRVCFAVESSRVTDFCRQLEKLPGVALEPKVRKMRGGSSEVRCSNALFAAVIEHALGKRRCHEKVIPGEWIVSWPEHSRRDLLRGLVDSDGHLAERSRGRRRYHYTTTSLDLARNLLSLLRSLRVVGGISASEPRQGGIVDGRRIEARRQSYVVHWSAYAIAGNSSGHKGMRRRFESAGRFHEGVVRAIRVEPSPPVVYDLEMDGHPSFVANGVLVHNSATPIYNYGDEFWNVLEILRPGALGTNAEFITEWCLTGEKHPIRDPKAFGSFLRDGGLMLRRTRKDVGRELPALQTIVQPVESGAVEMAANTTDLARLILGEGRGFEKMQAASQFDMALRQATGLAKSAYVAAFVRMLLEQGPVVLFGWHRLVYDAWAKAFEDLKDAKGRQMAPAWYTGSESASQKAEQIRRFTSGDTDLLIMSLRAGAGVDGLQHRASQVVIGELDWSPGCHVQCLGRLHRDGQRDPVTAYFLVSDQGADPTMVDVLDLKRQQLEGTIEPEGALSQAVSVDPHHVRKLAEAYLGRMQARR